MIVRSLSFLLLLFLTPLVSSKDDLTKKTVGTSGKRKSQRLEAFCFNFIDCLYSNSNPIEPKFYQQAANLGMNTCLIKERERYPGSMNQRTQGKENQVMYESHFNSLFHSSIFTPNLIFQPLFLT